MTQQLEKPLTPEQAKEQFLSEMEKITQLVRASKGLAPKPNDIISNLINIKEPLERTGFPTYTILTQCVYLKLGKWLYGEEAEILDVWSNYLMSALIAYKRQQRKEAIEMQRRVETPESSFYFSQPSQPQQPKKRFWQRKPKEQTEFRDK